MNKYHRIAEANQVFTPGFPISQKDLFAGRMDQLQRVIETLHAPGRHPVLFGQRGVGKTSLANILGQVFSNILSVKISCDGSDTFATVWNRILLTASVNFKQKALGFTGAELEKTVTLSQALGHDPTATKPAEIADLLRRMNSSAVVILDEFDKLTSQEIKSSFADLIKIVSDTAPLVRALMPMPSRTSLARGSPSTRTRPRGIERSSSIGKVICPRRFESRAACPAPSPSAAASTGLT